MYIPTHIQPPPLKNIDIALSQIPLGSSQTPVFVTLESPVPPPEASPRTHTRPLSGGAALCTYPPTYSHPHSKTLTLPCAAAALSAQLHGNFYNLAA